MCCNERNQGCQKPEKLKSKPDDCTPEQISSCHGSVEGHPCVETAGCEHPERLQGKPGDCAPEQVCQCHCNAANHQCESRK